MECFQIEKSLDDLRKKFQCDADEKSGIEGNHQRTKILQRDDSDEIFRLSRYFQEDSILHSILDITAGVLLIMNNKRQIVFANKAFLELSGVTNLNKVLGLRPGEALQCIHAMSSTHGCGTNKFCQLCGGNELLNKETLDEPQTNEYQIIRKHTQVAITLRMTIKQIKINDEIFTIFTGIDISDQNRRRALEKIFFHDIMNLAWGVQGYAMYLKKAPQTEQGDSIKTINHLSKHLIREIQSQRDLIAAENDELYVDVTEFKSASLLASILEIFNYHHVTQNKFLKIDKNAKLISIQNDQTLLGRVLTNMVKNSLEAIDPGETVTIGCSIVNEKILFWVHNPGEMPAEVQKQIFNRTFSTKGKARGLGTYSMKLIGERYLQGKVSFRTSAEEGTIFQIELPPHYSPPDSDKE